MEKYHRLGPMPGGSGEYANSVRRCLEHIKQDSSTRGQLTEWFLKAFPSEGKKSPASRTIKDYVNTIENLQLITEGNGKFLLSETANRFLETSDNSLLYQQLDSNYIGIHDLLELLEHYSTLEGVCSSLGKRTKTTWQTPRQCVIRLNWLQSLGFAIRNGQLYKLTGKGKRIVARESKSEEEPWKHPEIQDLIVELGNTLGYCSKKEYRMDSYKLDVVWKRTPNGGPSEVFEIQKSGNLRQALLNLKYAWGKGISRLFLVTTMKEELEAELVVENSLYEIKDMAKILTIKDIREWLEKVKTASNITVERGGYRGIAPRYRKPSRFAKVRSIKNKDEANQGKPKASNHSEREKKRGRRTE